jgi:protein-S-isoprenylcysteine O-methyltransferase Ste14
MKTQTTDKALRGTAWTVGLFYALIAFEFFYMATPFAVYFYGAYLPGLESLSKIRGIRWLTHFFLPHFAPSSSALINAASAIGAGLTAAGLLGFAIGAVQIYSRKLLKRGAAVGGIYRFIRHPQYASLILSGVGMLLLWPRFLAALFFVAMVFIYGGLASLEERECLMKYGPSYADYLRATPRFLPFHLPIFRSHRGRRSSHSKAVKVAGLLLSYGAATSLALGAAFVLQTYSLSHLYTYNTEHTVFVSLTPLDKATVERVARTAIADPKMKERIDAAIYSGSRLINYVMPWEWGMSEIPMNNAGCHETPENFIRGRFKVVFTRAMLNSDDDVRGIDIIRSAFRTVPEGEVWVNEAGQVAKFLRPPDKIFYGDAPVPIY